ncbi:MAG: M1 family metallopeptidase [Acidobacteria bacterium]|nr:M1 family metallopeptidase [Acidobacteriota bacterium]
MTGLKRLVALAVTAVWPLQAQPAHYSVKLRVDFERRVLVGVEDVELQRSGSAELRGGKGLKITRQTPDGTHFEYEAQAGRGLRWQEDGNLAAMFDCSAWMVCDSGPHYRSTLRLEIVVPVSGGGGRRAVGPGRLTRQFRSAQGEHFVFEVARPVQSYLFSFAVARLVRSAAGNFEVWSVRKAGPRVFKLFAEMYRVFRAKAGVDWLDSQYVQAFGSIRGAGQEAAGTALMSQEYLEDSVVVRLLAERRRDGDHDRGVCGTSPGPRGL